jgi:hypothetical protein
MTVATKSKVNNTTTPLASLGRFVGTDETTNDVVTIAVTVFSSTDGTLVIKQTNDKSTYQINLTYPVKAGVRIMYGQPVVKKFFHVEFQNDQAVDQSYLLVRTVFYTNYTQDSNINYRPVD